jgi:flavin-binding protein dodecin
MSCKTKVLRVLWNESKVYTLLAVHHNSIHKIELIKTDSASSDRADETALQQADVVIIDIDVREYIGQNGSQHISSVEELFNTAGIHTFDNSLFAFGTFTIDGF